MGTEAILVPVIVSIVSFFLGWLKEKIEKRKVLKGIADAVENDLTPEQSKAAKEAIAKGLLNTSKTAVKAMNNVLAKKGYLGKSVK